MAEILLISGSPTASSKSAALLEYSRTWLREKAPFESVLVSVRDFPADDLILARYDSPAFDGFKQQVSNALGIIVSTPVYKAAYTGSLKALLDILPQYAFRGKNHFAHNVRRSPWASASHRLRNQTWPLNTWSQRRSQRGLSGRSAISYRKWPTGNRR